MEPEVEARTGAGATGPSAPATAAHRPATPRGDHHKTGAGSAPVALFVLIAVVAAAGLFLRIWILGNAPINSDEATAGLIAHDILHGHTYAFYWGQGYGGVEPYVLAAVFTVFGQSPLTLNATPALLALIGSALVWRIGLRLFPPPAAIVAAVLSWIWAESTLWNSTRETGFRQVCVVLGLVVLLQTVRITQGARRRAGDRLADWVVFGAAVGLGLWSSPEIVYFALPGGLVVLLTLWHRPVAAVASRLLAAGVAALAGALPLIWDTVTGQATGIPPSPVSYPSRLSTFFTHVLPMALGLRIEGAGQWEGGGLLGGVVCAVLLVAVGTAAVLLAVRSRDALVLVVILALFPFLYTAFPTSWFWNDGRYALALPPVLSLVIAGGIWLLVRPPAAGWVACALLVAALASTLVAFDAGYGALGSPGRLTQWSADPNVALTSLARRLEGLGANHAYAGYWVANDLTFASGGRVIAEALGQERNPPEASTVGSARTVAWIFVASDQTAAAAGDFGSSTDLDPGPISQGALTTWLDAHGVPFRTASTGVFTVIVPARNISPAQLSETPAG